MLCGFVAVASRVVAEHDSALTFWANIGAIVGGVIAAALFLFGLVRSLWRWRHRPKVVVECGSGPVYERQIYPEPRHDAAARNRTGGVYMTRLQVRETSNAMARGVHLRITSTDPSPENPAVFPAGLQWLGGEDYYDIPPRGRAYVRLCELVERRPLPALVLTSVPNLARGQEVTFNVEALIGESSAFSATFSARWEKDARYPVVTCL
jgi:hypothetical protein